MEFSQVIQSRRSIRRFRPEPVPEKIIITALEDALLAPNSSNTQTWDFYWVRQPEIKNKLVHFCLDQSAARTAAELVVITCDPSKWKRSQHGLVKWAVDSKAPEAVKMYYEKLVPLTYRWGLFNSLGLVKWLITQSVGLFRPMPRGPYGLQSLQEVAIKSAALASENFVLSLANQGVATCMMEGFDECRVKKLLKLKRSTRIVMVIACGYEAERGTWGPRFRLPFDEVIHRIE